MVSNDPFKMISAGSEKQAFCLLIITVSPKRFLRNNQHMRFYCQIIKTSDDSSVMIFNVLNIITCHLDMSSVRNRVCIRELVCQFSL